MFSKRIKQYWRLSAVRQTVWLILVFAVISTVALGATFWLTYKEMINAVDERLILRMDAAVIAIENGAQLPDPEEGQIAKLTKEQWQEGFQTTDVARKYGSDTRYLVRKINDQYVVLGEGIDRQEEVLEILAVGMQISLLFTLLASLAASLWLAIQGQNRLNQITDGLAKVGRGQLNTPIQIDGDDDLSLLAGQINETANRLNGAIRQIKTQSSHIAHDLRTPLTRLRLQLELNLNNLIENHEAVSQDELEDAIDQIDMIDQIFDALLRLSQIESGAGRSLFAEVDLNDLVIQTYEAYEAVVADSGQTLTVEISHADTVMGDADLLIQLLANLLQNALRYGAPSQQIIIRLDGNTLSVSDEGPGIPSEEHEKVLQPLYQGESTRQGEGHGLGLSMVKAICELHNADLVLSDGPNRRGLRVTVNFPTLTKL